MPAVPAHGYLPAGAVGRGVENHPRIYHTNTRITGRSHSRIRVIFEEGFSILWQIFAILDIWRVPWDREIALDILREHQAELRERGVKSLALSGLVARGEASDESDLDPLVEFDCFVGLLDFVSLKSYLEDIIGCRIDLVTEDALRPDLRERILQDAINLTPGPFPKGKGGPDFHPHSL